MALYARRPWRLAGQLAADAFVAVWVVVWAVLGRLTFEAVRDVAAPARDAARAAGRLSTQVGQVAEQAGGVPGVGARLRQPLDAASTSLTELLTALDRQVAGVERLAQVSGWLVFAIPVTIVVALWLPRRIAFHRRARAAPRFLDATGDLDLFALRALTSQPVSLLARISDDPLAGWRAQDATVIHKLAELELRRCGVRMPTVAVVAPRRGGTPGEGPSTRADPARGWEREG